MRLDDLTLLITVHRGGHGHRRHAAVLARAGAARGGARRVLRAACSPPGGHGHLAAAQNLVTLFLGLELLSIPLYVLCATEMRRAKSLESGLKYLIVGSVGSATFLYGLALLYGATGDTDFRGIAQALLHGHRRTTSCCSPASRWPSSASASRRRSRRFTSGRPTSTRAPPRPITAFMAVATKAAAFGAMLRLFDVALIDAQPDWGPMLAILATVTILVGNVGALGQSSLKRMLAWSSVAQAGYLLAGVVVATRLGVQATVFYLSPTSS